MKIGLNGGIKPLSECPLTNEERQELRQSLKSSNGLTVRRAQMLLLSADEGLKVDTIRQPVGGTSGDP